jgi:hypothetical protein
VKNIAVFYLIGQFESWWDTDFYLPQIELLKKSGLYENIDFIDIFVAGGKSALPVIPDRIRNISYCSVPLKEESQAMQAIWDFASNNPGYKILFFHSEGVTHLHRTTKENKLAWRRHLEYCNIELWSTCIELLNFYDCLGADYIHQCTFSNGETVIRAPHYPGFFWWANSNYIRRLNRNYFNQNVSWSRYLAELWIGSEEPRYYCMNKVDHNFYFSPPFNFDPIEIKHKNTEHLKKLKINTRGVL